LNPLLAPLLEQEDYKKAISSLKQKITPVLITGVIDVQQTHMMYAIGAHTNRPLLVITHSESRAKEIQADLSFFQEDTVYYPAKDILFYSADVRSKDILKQRASLFHRLYQGKQPPIVLSAESLLDALIPQKVLHSFILELKEGQVIEPNTIIEQLLFMGYERTEQIEAIGQFSVRGGILDIFSPTMEQGLRLEFWDNEIDSIRLMEVDTQRSIQKMDVPVQIFPVAELLFNEATLEKGISLITKEFAKVQKNLEKKGETEILERLQRNIGESLEKQKEEKFFRGMDGYLPFFYEKTESLLDYLSSDTLVFYDEPQRIREHMNTLCTEYEQGLKNRMEQGYLLPTQTKIIFSYDDILHRSKDFAEILLTTISQRVTDFKPKELISFTVKSTPAFQNRIDLFCQEVKLLKKEGYRILVLAGGKTRCQRMVQELLERQLEATLTENLADADLPTGSILVAQGRLSRGFQYPSIRFAVFSEKEILGESQKKKSARKKKKNNPLESFTDWKVGDYVVHESHGIGIFRGLEKINIDGFHKDYLKIAYANGGSIFVSVNQMDVIQKYIGSNALAPKLNKLGGQEWNKAKTKVRTAVKDLAEDLVALYAKRQMTKGFSYSKDTLWQREFEEEFPYTETDDQLSAIEDVKRDMEGDGVMDRLICGDVGYGKTEVALRAAFKAVQDGKQVAYLVPTTILAQQHYHTFLQRMETYPIGIELLSRFRTPKEQKESIEKLNKGLSDIVIGTHRILSKDVSFKNLGMIIVDEEQRFGVSHKEKMKAMKENLDVLTLTATPIPRTLHMSLSGIRDMSLLEEPPQERHPIQTYVMENNNEFVREAILRELNRDGQVFYLYNRVESIAEESFRLQKLVPEAMVAFAHGKMTERQLEQILEDFVEGAIDVLVCTTIIETGMDIPNVNTMIIQDADRFGLSQLYQLRGRVGRSNRIAYAYLMYQRDKILQENAEKRLQTIKEFTEFGSGFKIAMRDLEIRGAGNLLGAQQHGHMEAVGYDMYCRLLEEEVNNLKGGTNVSETFETTLDININAYLPDFYIKNQEQRMEIYKKIAAVETKKDYFTVQEEIEDRFGNLPKNVQSLLEVALAKAQAHSLGITAITQKQDSILLTFRQDATIDPIKFTQVLSSQKNAYYFTAGINPYLTIKMKKSKNDNAFSYIHDFLNAILPET